MLRKSLVAVATASALLVTGPVAARPTGGIWASTPKAKKVRKAAAKESEPAQTNSAADAPSTAPSNGNGTAPSDTGATAAQTANGSPQAASGPAQPPECTADKPC